jgi:glycosyltransferase involved in cell wall biosynthesis
LTPETVTLAQIARRLGIKTICVPMASGAYGDVSRFPPTAPHDTQAFDWISALTAPLRDEIVGWGYPEDRISVIPNGVDTVTFSPPTSPCDEPQVIFVGQFRPEKRVSLLLHAWQQVQLIFPDVRLILVGGGRYLSQYQQMAARLGIAPTVIPNTDSASVLVQLQASSIFVLPGISEGMSNALLEAMAVGLAPIASDTPANHSVITPEFDGLCYPADSVGALAAQLTRLIGDSALRKRIGAAARETAVQRFNLDHVVDQYLDLYSQLLGEPL